jgi:hypothetical protein
VIADHTRCEESGELEPAVAVGRSHHGDLDALVAKSGDTPCPVSFDRGSTFEFEAELAEEHNGRRHVFDDDADIGHPLDRHVIDVPADGQLNTSNRRSAKRIHPVVDA